MAQTELNQQTQNIIERGKEVVARGNQRHLVLRKQDGTQLFETSLTIAVAVGVALLVSGFITFPVIVIAALAAYFTKVRAELRRDEPTLSDD
jgi:hypothetical protein